MLVTYPEILGVNGRKLNYELSDQPINTDILPKFAAGDIVWIVMNKHQRGNLKGWCGNYPMAYFSFKDDDFLTSSVQFTGELPDKIGEWKPTSFQVVGSSPIIVLKPFEHVEYVYQVKVGDFHPDIRFIESALSSDYDEVIMQCKELNPEWTYKDSLERKFWRSMAIFLPSKKIDKLKETAAGPACEQWYEYERPKIYIEKEKSYLTRWVGVFSSLENYLAAETQLVPVAVLIHSHTPEEDVRKIQLHFKELPCHIYRIEDDEGGTLREIVV